MKRFAILLTMIVLLIGVGYLVGTVGYPMWGRRLIYQENSTKTKYPGLGQAIEKTEAKILVSPKGEGLPFFDLAWMRMKYPPDDYEIVELPAQDRLMYTVGKVVGWEDIAGSNDKYLLAQISKDGGTAKYRISFGGENETLLAVENVSWRVGDKANPVAKYATPRVSEIGYDRLSSLIKVGDSVVLMPVFAVPEYAKKDESGNYLVSWLMVRRVDDKL